MIDADYPGMAEQRREIYWRVFNENSEESQRIRSAKALAAFLREKDLVLWKEDLLAGYEQFYDYSQPIDASQILGQVNEEDRVVLNAVSTGHNIGLYGGALGGHVIAGYQRVLELGFGELGHRAEQHSRNGNAQGRDFAMASSVVCKAASDYALRYAEKAEALSLETGNTENRHHHTKIGKACRWIATRPARSFFEAVQLLWLTHEITTCEQRSGSLSLGRFDQYLYPYYRQNLDNGVMTREEAADLIKALWIKFGGMKRGFQHVVLGGADAAGAYQVNELSFLCLEATSELRMDQPLISVRWHQSMPDDFWNAVQHLIKQGMGFPALFNDEVAVSAKKRLGIPDSDAQEYGVVGCVELSIPGKEFSHTEELRVSWAKVLELMLHGGRCPVTGERIILKNSRDLDSIGSFEEFYGWYEDELAYFTDLAIRGRNIEDAHFSDYRPYPFLSSTMYGCLESGLDVTAGGTIYNFSTVNGCGMANAVNSLHSICRAVFEHKICSLSELAATLLNSDSTNVGVTELQYGNDRTEPDEIMQRITACFCGEIERHVNPRGGKFQIGLYTVDGHSSMGKLTGVLPDGRKRCAALASGFSPSQGTDVSGPTAVVKSTTKIDHRRLGNGMVLDLKFQPSFFEDESQARAFRHLVETYFSLGGMEIQFNVIDRSTLLEAQKHPDQHRDLIVRVSGFSAYFADLAVETQDEIIARTEHVAV